MYIKIGVLYLKCLYFRNKHIHELFLLKIMNSKLNKLFRLSQKYIPEFLLISSAIERSKYTLHLNNAFKFTEINSGLEINCFLFVHFLKQ